MAMPISYARHRFPPVIIQHAVWLYLRFTFDVLINKGGRGLFTLGPKSTGGGHRRST